MSVPSQEWASASLKLPPSLNFSQGEEERASLQFAISCPPQPLHILTGSAISCPEQGRTLSPRGLLSSSLVTPGPERLTPLCPCHNHRGGQSSL